jgi:alpha/beta hydrolase family protein
LDSTGRTLIPGVQRIVELLERGERTVPYWHLVKRFPNRFANPGFAYKYATAWLLILATYLSTSALWNDSSRLTRALIVILPLWHVLPSWYAVSGQDRAIDPALQRFMAQRAGSTTVQFAAASHVGGLTHYRARFVKLIEQAVQATGT